MYIYIYVYIYIYNHQFNLYMCVADFELILIYFDGFKQTIGSRTPSFQDLGMGRIQKLCFIYRFWTRRRQPTAPAQIALTTGHFLNKQIMLHHTGAFKLWHAMACHGHPIMCVYLKNKCV